MSANLPQWQVLVSAWSMLLNCRDRRSRTMSICLLTPSFLWRITTAWKMLMSLATRKRLNFTVSRCWLASSALPRISTVNIWLRQLRLILGLCFCQRKVSIPKWFAIQSFSTVCDEMSRLSWRVHLPCQPCSTLSQLALKP